MDDKEYAALDKTLSRLVDCDLNEWDRDFVDSMIKRVGRYGRETSVSPRQWEQLDRMERQYL